MIDLGLLGAPFREYVNAIDHGVIDLIPFVSRSEGAPQLYPQFHRTVDFADLLA